MNKESKSKVKKYDILDSIMESDWFQILSLISTAFFVIFISGKVMKVVSGTITEFKTLKSAIQL